MCLFLMLGLCFFPIAQQHTTLTYTEADVGSNAWQLVGHDHTANKQNRELLGQLKKLFCILGCQLVLSIEVL